MKPVIDRLHTNDIDSHSHYTQQVDIKEQSGRYHGEQARLVQNPQSLIESAAEELTFGLADREGDNRTRKKNKKEMKEALGIQKELVKEVERRKQLEDSTDKMKKRSMRNIREMRAFLEAYDSDPYRQHQLLRHAKKQLSGQPVNQALLELIHQAETELETTYGESIRAGQNIQGVADDFAITNGAIDDRQLQGFYRSAVLDYGGLAQTYGKIREQHGSAGVDQGFRFLLKALAADYRAQGSSIDKNHLAMIMQDMHQLRLLNTLYEHCSEILQRRDELMGYTAQQFMQDVLDIQDSQWLEDAAIRAFTLRSGADGSEAVIGFLRDLKGTFNLLPAENFSGDEQREHILDRIQACQDYHIRKEEEAHV